MYTILVFGKEKSSDKLKKQSQKRFRNYPKVEHPGRILPQDQNLPFVNHGNGTSTDSENAIRKITIENKILFFS